LSKGHQATCTPAELQGHGGWLITSAFVPCSTVLSQELRDEVVPHMVMANWR
jgi:hypothetical protein